MELEETIYTKCPNCGGRIWMDDESSKRFFSATEDITALQFLAAATFWCAGCGRTGTYEELKTSDRAAIEEQWHPLSELRAGAIFETREGKRGVKCGFSEWNNHSCTISLQDGSAVFFNDEEPLLVREIAI